MWLSKNTNEMHQGILFYIMLTEINQRFLLGFFFAWKWDNRKKGGRLNNSDRQFVFITSCSISQVWLPGARLRLQHSVGARDSDKWGRKRKGGHPPQNNLVGSQRVSPQGSAYCLSDLSWPHLKCNSSPSADVELKETGLKRASKRLDKGNIFFHVNKQNPKKCLDIEGQWC